jgi:metal-responsive CopG/Arc/MetJ family transcriptional regulator
LSQLSRTGVSLEEDLLKEFDRLITKRGYQNRSEAIRDLIREALLAEIVDSNKPVVGTLALVSRCTNSWNMVSEAVFRHLNSGIRRAVFVLSPDNF